MSTTDEEVQLALDALDVGVVLCTLERDRILVANRAARDALSELGDGNGDALATLRARFSGCAAHAQSAVFSPAEPLVAASGKRFFARGKRIGDPARLLITLTAALLRDRDLDQILRERYDLTQRERQVVSALRSGLSNEQIAASLSLSVATIKAYLTTIFDTLAVKSRMELLAMVERLDAGAPRR